MKKILISSLFLVWLTNLQGQQLHFNAWSGLNRTMYDLPKYSDNQGFLVYGGRIAFGHQNIQIGAEYETNLNNPSFDISDNDGNIFQNETFEHTYYGALIRLNSAKIPAYRAGLILKLGGGIYDSKFILTELPDGPTYEPINYDEKFLGFNGAIGISAPIYRVLHWEVFYQFNYTNIPELQAQSILIPEFKAIHHSLQVGISLNFVFGETARRAKEILKARG